MAVSSGLYNAFKLKANKGLSWALGADTLKVCLTIGTGSTWKPNNHQGDTTPIFADIGADECSGANYTSGGLTVTHTPVWQQDNANNRAELVVGSPYTLVWTAVTLTNMRYAVLYNATRTNNLIGWVDFGSDNNPVAADLTITWATDHGIAGSIMIIT